MKKEITETHNSNTSNLDKLSISEIIKIINDEDSNIPLLIKEIIPQINLLIEKVVQHVKHGGRLIYVGSGTSGRLGVLDASECPPTFSTSPDIVIGLIAGGKKALYRSVEGAEDETNSADKDFENVCIKSKDIVIGLSSSGSTSYVHRILSRAKDKKAFTCLITSNYINEEQYIDQIICIVVGPEIISGSTRMKAGTATKMTLNMITTTAMIKLNKTYGNLMVDLKASNQKLWDRGTRIIEHITDLNYNEALKLLQFANGEVKIALVMEKLKLGVGDAREKLINQNGSLKDVFSGF